jgi:colanic acid biosynthesis glycosyl transferase WcaI
MTTQSNRPLRILLLTQFFTPEPETSRGISFAKWLQARGHDVKVLTGFPNYPTGVIYPGYKVRMKQWETIDGVPVLRVPLYPNHDRSAIRRMANYFSFAASATAIGIPMVGDVDVVYVMATPHTIAIPALANLIFRRVPYVFNVIDMWPEAVTESGILRTSLSMRAIEAGIAALCEVLFSHATSVTAISRGYARMLVERGLSRQRVHAVYNWVDENLYKPTPRNEKLAAELGLAGKFNFLYGGNFGPFQGLDVLIRAAARLTHIPDIQVTMVGTGLMDAELRQLAQDVGATNVHFTGRIDQFLMPEVYALGDVLVMHLNDSAYLRATVPGKTQVYMAMQRPIVMGAVGEAADILNESGAGIVVPPRDHVAFADAMLELYHRTPAEREELAANGRAYYLEHMSLDHGGAHIERLLHEAAARDAAH